MQIRSAPGEETVRLRSHIEATRKELTAGGSVGRKLDFIAQEMNREANTILSKANDLEVSDCAIALKTEIEKVRERFRILNSRQAGRGIHGKLPLVVKYGEYEIL